MALLDDMRKQADDDTAVLVVNDELRYVATAGAGLAEQGYTDITGKRLDDVVAAADRDALAAFYRSAVDGQEGRISFTSSKTGRSYEVDAVPLPRSLRSPSPAQANRCPAVQALSNSAAALASSLGPPRPPA